MFYRYSYFEIAYNLVFYFFMSFFPGYIDRQLDIFQREHNMLQSKKRLRDKKREFEKRKKEEEERKLAEEAKKLEDENLSPTKPAQNIQNEGDLDEVKIEDE